jgi:pyruvate/2-oxoglutarate dehydrogenase complex dihydrolipoamide acyltransferase (E2) component
VPFEVRLPRLSPGMQQGIIVQWLVAAGETVTIGQPLVQVESDKALLDVEAPAAGRLARIAQPKGSKVPVGALLAVID